MGVLMLLKSFPLCHSATKLRIFHQIFYISSLLWRDLQRLTLVPPELNLPMMLDAMIFGLNSCKKENSLSYAHPLQSGLEKHTAKQKEIELGMLKKTTRNSCSTPTPYGK